MNRAILRFPIMMTLVIPWVFASNSKAIEIVVKDEGLEKAVQAVFDHTKLKVPRDMEFLRVEQSSNGLSISGAGDLKFQEGQLDILTTDSGNPFPSLVSHMSSRIVRQDDGNFKAKLAVTLDEVDLLFHHAAIHTSEREISLGGKTPGKIVKGEWDLDLNDLRIESRKPSKTPVQVDLEFDIDSNGIIKNSIRVADKGVFNIENFCVSASETKSGESPIRGRLGNAVDVDVLGRSSDSVPSGCTSRPGRRVVRDEFAHLVLDGAQDALSRMLKDKITGIALKQNDNLKKIVSKLLSVEGEIGMALNEVEVVDGKLRALVGANEYCSESEGSTAPYNQQESLNSANSKELSIRVNEDELNALLEKQLEGKIGKDAEIYLETKDLGEEGTRAEIHYSGTIPVGREYGALRVDDIVARDFFAGVSFQPTSNGKINIVPTQTALALIEVNTTVDGQKARPMEFQVSTTADRFRPERQHTVLSADRGTANQLLESLIVSKLLPSQLGNGMKILGRPDIELYSTDPPAVSVNVVLDVPKDVVKSGMGWFEAFQLEAGTNDSFTSLKVATSFKIQLEPNGSKIGARLLGVDKAQIFVPASAITTFPGLDVIASNRFDELSENAKADIKKSITKTLRESVNANGGIDLNSDSNRSFLSDIAVNRVDRLLQNSTPLNLDPAKEVIGRVANTVQIEGIRFGRDGEILVGMSHQRSSNVAPIASIDPLSVLARENPDVAQHLREVFDVDSLAIDILDDGIQAGVNFND